jgi:hypothetical protein
MKPPWFKSQPGLLNRTLRDVAADFPDLHAEIFSDSVAFRGSLPLSYQGEELDRYQVEITLGRGFPNESIPKIKELQNRIPHTADWHNPDNLCVMVPEEWLIDPRRESLVEFLRGPVRDFLLGHSLAEMGEGRPLGERPHNLAGLLQAYGEWFGVSDKETICRYLGCLRKSPIKGHWPCPCGSGRVIRRCHVEQLRLAQKRIRPEVASAALFRVRFVEQRMHELEQRGAVKL